jgi:hypothetical protein
MDGRVTLSANEALVEFTALTLRQVLEPLCIEVLWFGDIVMQLIAGEGRGPDRITMVDGTWTEALANLREELEARFGSVELNAGHRHLSVRPRPEGR